MKIINVNDNDLVFVVGSINTTDKDKSVLQPFKIYVGNHQISVVQNVSMFVGTDTLTPDVTIKFPSDRVLSKSLSDQVKDNTKRLKTVGFVKVTQNDD